MYIFIIMTYTYSLYEIILEGYDLRPERTRVARVSHLHTVVYTMHTWLCNKIQKPYA